MPLVLKQVRDCDGACCQESPRWPNKDRTDCIYRDPTIPNKGCKITAGIESVPKGMSPVIPDKTGAEVYQMSCVEWPQKHCEPRLGETSNCCWQWIDGD